MYCIKNHIYDKLTVVKANSSNVPRSRIIARHTGIIEDLNNEAKPTFYQ